MSYIKKNVKIGQTSKKLETRSAQHENDVEIQSMMEKDDI